MAATFVHLLVLLVFVNRYFLGRWLRHLRGENFDPRMDIEGREPTVAIVVPLFNEGEGIYRTIRSLLEQDYPADRRRIVVVDDCSTDDSHAWAWKAACESDRVTVLRNATNLGKRRSINHAVRRTEAEIIVSVDSDVVLERSAVRELVARFTDPRIAAVGGRVHVVNANQNWLTRMQAIKYWFGYEYLKELERAFRSVMCLSGCLTAYRREVLLRLEPILENRNVLGIPIKYGEDRFLTRQIVKAGWQTVMTLDAVSYTVAPATLARYFSQQLRWRRSNLIDYLGGISHAWRLHPVVAIHYFSTFAMLVAYPVMVVEALVSQSFWALTLLHAGILALLGTIYWAKTRDMPANLRVSPIWFLAMAALMPVTYLLLTPLAFFTLDSGSWETRGKPKHVEQKQLEPSGVERLDVGPAT